MLARTKKPTQGKPVTFDQVAVERTEEGDIAICFRNRAAPDDPEVLVLGATDAYDIALRIVSLIIADAMITGKPLPTLES